MQKIKQKEGDIGMNRKKILKPPRVFKLTKPRLRKIRRELRMLIRLAALDEYDRLDHLYHLYRYKEMPPDRSASNPPNYMPPSQLKRQNYLGFKKNQLQQAFKHSICMCEFWGDWRDPDCVKGDRVRAYSIPGDARIPGMFSGEECEVTKMFFSTEKWASEVPPHFHTLRDAFMSVFKMNLHYCLNHGKRFISWRESEKRYELKEFGRSTV